jgi:hypothetical protein
MYQDNTSAIKLEINGKESSGKRTRHFDIKFFYLTDLIKRGKMQVENCQTNEMDADYMTKLFVRAKSIKFRSCIMDAR